MANRQRQVSRRTEYKPLQVYVHVGDIEALRELALALHESGDKSSMADLVRAGIKHVLAKHYVSRKESGDAKR